MSPAQLLRNQATGSVLHEVPVWPSWERHGREMIVNGLSTGPKELGCPAGRGGFRVRHLCEHSLIVFSLVYAVPFGRKSLCIFRKNVRTWTKRRPFRGYNYASSPVFSLLAGSFAERS